MTKLHVGKGGEGERGNVSPPGSDPTFHPRHPTNQQEVVTDVREVIVGVLPQMSAVQLPALIALTDHVDRKTP
jgi:hypothetical protein